MQCVHFANEHTPGMLSLVSCRPPSRRLRSLCGISVVSSALFFSPCISRQSLRRKRPYAPGISFGHFPGGGARLRRHNPFYCRLRHSGIRNAQAAPWGARCVISMLGAMQSARGLHTETTQMFELANVVT